MNRYGITPGVRHTQRHSELTDFITDGIYRHQWNSDVVEAKNSRSWPSKPRPRPGSSRLRSRPGPSRPWPRPSRPWPRPKPLWSRPRPGPSWPIFIWQPVLFLCEFNFASSTHYFAFFVYCYLDGCSGLTTVPCQQWWLSEWVTPRDTAIPGMTSLKDGDLQHSSALAQSPKGDIELNQINPNLNSRSRIDGRSRRYCNTG